MMKIRYLLILLLIIIFSNILAVPFTALGEIKVPDAYVLPHKMAEASYVSYFYANLDGNEDNEYNHEFAGNINIGVLDRLELGFVGVGEDIFYLNAKANLIKEKENVPSISIGIDNLFSQVPEFREDSDENVPDDIEANYTDADDYIRNSFYIVLTKSSLVRGLPFIPYLETTMHLGMGRRRFEGNIKLSKQLAGLFFCLEAKPLNWMSIIAEMDGYNVNTGLKIKYKNVAFRAGAYRIEELDRRQLKYAFNLVYTFDYWSEVKVENKNLQYAERKTVVPGKQVISREGDVLSGSPLMDELEAIRQRRRRAEKQLDEIKELLEEEE